MNAGIVSAASSSTAEVEQSDSTRRVLVIVPAHNEEHCIRQTIKEVRVAVAAASILVVDDGSSDRTAALARSAGVDVLRLPFNLGVGGAMRAGYKFAERHGYDAAVQVDADGQHDPADIPALLRVLDIADGGSAVGSVLADIVIGARFAERGDYPVRGPRRWAMRHLARTLSKMSRTRLTDTTSGFRATNRRAISLYARHYPAEYLGDTVESLVIAIRSGLRVSQVPVEMRLRQGGVPSQRPAAAAMYLFRALVALNLARVRRWPDYVGTDDDSEVRAHG